ncbi:sodium-dependent transporter, partial [Verrucomicrobiota bacterium]
MDAGQDHQPRETWNTRGAFVLAAIGSAVGLGNLWGFPYKVYSYGGGAFLVPYFIAMVVMGVPLLIMEFATGHWAQLAAPSAFGRIANRYRFVGWWLVALAFVIITYYTVILGYCVIFLIESVKGMLGSALPWAGGTEAAGEHFFTDLLAYEGGLGLTGMRWPILMATLASWILIYLCLFRGVNWVSRVVLLTVPLPWIMLIVLAVRGLTLEGAVTGLQFYLEPHWEKLAEADTWRWAFGQVFFSMSLGFAVMLSYASFLHRTSDLNNNALIIGLGDMGTSFVAGIAVFSTLGAMAMADNTAVEEVVAGGPGLAFVTFPYALSRLPAAQGLFSLVFFLALLTLGIDSAFSIVEACLASVCDSKPSWPRRWVLPGVCAVGALIGILYCFGGGGLNWLGYVDDIINGPMGILVVALAECLVIGWAWRGKFLHKMREHANERSDWKLYGWWDVTVKYIAPAFLAVLIAWSVADFVVSRKWLLLAGSAVFALIPVGLALGIRARPDDEDGSSEERDDGLAAWLLLLVPLCSALAGAAIGGVRLLGVGGAPADEPAAEVAGFVARDLGVTAYVVLSVALVVIFGGLVWCFWRALQAA